ncbi:MAG: hypothetical protein JWL85_854 [Candidatus Saccharibacteria bacterium]|nr:hypothetical protein [Candidatus Saccharibacteria bacterium]
MYFSYLQGNRSGKTHYGHAHDHEKTWAVIAACAVSIVVLAGFLTHRVFNHVAAIETPVVQMSSLIPRAPEPITPAIVPVVTDNKKLQDEINAWIASQKGSDWGVSVRSVYDDSVNAHYNRDKQFETASVYKAFLVLPLATKIPASSWQTTKLNEKQSYAECLDLALRMSNNACGEGIARALGWKYIDQVLYKAGYTGTKFNRKDYIATTPADTTLLFSNLYKGVGFDKATREFALKSLAPAKNPEAIRRACSGCEVYNKWGEFNGMKNDAAIVTKDGKTYVIAIFSKNSTWPKVTELAGVITRNL